MRELFFVVEGQTEETFVNIVLRSHLESFGIASHVKKLGIGPVKGGKVNLDRLAGDLRRLRHLDRYFTTMLDFDTFHELKTRAKGTTPWQRVEHAERLLHEDLLRRDCIGGRFIPFLQLHDFESLVLADPSAMRSQFLEDDDRKAIDGIQKAFAEVEPESVDHDKPPCKRIEELLPGYSKRKSGVGPLITQSIGLPRLRERCPHFDRWLSKLEALE